MSLGGDMFVSPRRSDDSPLVVIVGAGVGWSGVGTLAVALGLLDSIELDVGTLAVALGLLDDNIGIGVSIELDVGTLAIALGLYQMGWQKCLPQRLPCAGCTPLCYQVAQNTQAAGIQW